ncbi:hypothetical protein OHAE_2033 [Ochrobactrum soli]|uniref:Uncharacterized protein n=1 Tax=Ochrobactrum soli TaxID=2448455 RepID=A0A2P9HPV6_9HYPH|nr:hypothetical protein OHAE_2033 [[Ochrobactrum] soli]
MEPQTLVLTMAENSLFTRFSNLVAIWERNFLDRMAPVIVS